MSTGRSIPESHRREIISLKSISILHCNNEHINKMKQNFISSTYGIQAALTGLNALVWNEIGDTISTCNITVESVLWAIGKVKSNKAAGRMGWGHGCKSRGAWGGFAFPEILLGGLAMDPAPPEKPGFSPPHFSLYEGAYPVYCSKP